MADWKKRAEQVPSQAEAPSWKQRAVKEEYYNPVEKAGMKTLKALVSIPGVVPTFEALDKYVQSPIRRAAQEGVGKAIEQYGEKAPSMYEYWKKEGVSDVPLSQKLPSLYSDKPEEYSKPFVWKKGGLFDWSAAEALGKAEDIALDPTTYITVGGAKKAIQKGITAGETALQKAIPGAATIEKVGQAIRPAEVKGAVTGLREGLGATVEALGEKFNPKLAKDAAKSLETVKKLGIPDELIPDTLLVEKTSDMSRMYKALAQGPGGEAARVKHTEFLNALKEKAIENIDDISGKTVGQLKDNASKGRLVIDSFEKARESLKNKIDWDRGMVYQQNPGIGFSPQDTNKMLNAMGSVSSKLDNLTGAIDENVANQASRAKKLIDERITMAVATGDAKTVHEALQYLGNISNGAESRMVNPSIKKALNDAYFEISKVYDGMAGKRLGKQIQNQIVENNKLWTEFFRAGDDFSSTLSNEISPELVYKRVVSGGNSQEIKKLYDFLQKNNPQAANSLKGLVAEDILKPDISGEFKFGVANNRLKSQQMAAKYKSILSPEEIKNLQDIINLGERAGDYTLNPSGTEISRSFTQAATEIPRESFNRAFYEANLSKIKGMSAPKKDLAKLLQAVNAPAAQQKPSVSGLMDFLNKKATIGMATPIIKQGSENK